MTTRAGLQRWGGERKRSRSKATNTVVVLVDTSDPETELDPAGGRWATLCEDHATVVNHGTRKDAESFMPVPYEWCEECARETAR